MMIEQCCSVSWPEPTRAWLGMTSDGALLGFHSSPSTGMVERADTGCMIILHSHYSPSSAAGYSPMIGYHSIHVCAARH